MSSDGGSNDASATSDSALASGSAARVSFDEFKLYFESADAVTERRVSLNRFNYTVATAVLVGLGAIVKYGFASHGVRLLSAAAIVVISCLAIVFCFYWSAQISDAKQLNNAKFKILEEMAPRILFDSGTSGCDVRSYRPFQKEWALLQSAQALATIGTGASGLKALKGSKAELYVPRSFAVVYAGSALVACMYIALNYTALAKEPYPIVESSAVSVPAEPEGPHVEFQRDLSSVIFT